MVSNGVLKIRYVEQHLVPRDRPVMQPAPWSLLLADAYARHLCRTQHAARVEIIRHTRPTVPPAVMVGEMPGGGFDEMTANFGELPR
jgi:hypothetical protein